MMEVCIAKTFSSEIIRATGIISFALTAIMISTSTN